MIKMEPILIPFGLQRVKVATATVTMIQWAKTIKLISNPHMKDTLTQTWAKSPVENPSVTTTINLTKQQIKIEAFTQTQYKN